MHVESLIPTRLTPEVPQEGFDGNAAYRGRLPCATRLDSALDYVVRCGQQLLRDQETLLWATPQFQVTKVYFKLTTEQ